MAIVINSNMQSKRAQGQLEKSSAALQKTYERLSSGQRINRASDDAAGLAIAESLNTKSRVFTTGVRNLNDGLSLLSIADSAMTSLTDITIRLKELATQAASGSYSRKQREALDAEAQALSKEFTRITTSTSFNGTKIFDGSMQGIRLQGGYGVDGSIFSTLGGQKGSGNFSESQVYTQDAGTSSVATGDLNGDGFIDIVTSDYNANTLSIRLGNSDGTFGTRTFINVGGEPNFVTLGDVNGDGKLDIVASHYSASGLQVFTGDGKGGFTFSTTLSTSGFTGEAKLADIDRDGNLDILASDANGSVNIYMGTGGGNFAARKNLHNAINFLTYLSIGDVNNDGNLDIVSTADGATNSFLYLGTGGGNFQGARSITTGLNTTSVALADFNNDGKLDIAATSFNGDRITVSLGNGDGTFTGQMTYETGESPISLIAGDLNGDGFIDLVSANANDDNLTVLLGAGDGSFKDRKTLNAGYAPNSVKLADLNGDSILDVIAANISSGDVSIFRGLQHDGIGSLLQFSLTTQADALQSIPLFDNKLKSLSSQRGIIGAFSSRLTTAISALFSSSENIKAAESRIRDADIADDAAALSRLQILQQTGAAILAQSNQAPQIALSLLR